MNIPKIWAGISRPSKFRTFHWSNFFQNFILIWDLQCICSAFTYLWFLLFVMHLLLETFVKLQFHTDNDIPSLTMIRERVRLGREGARDPEANRETSAIFLRDWQAITGVRDPRRWWRRSRSRDNKNRGILSDAVDRGRASRPTRLDRFLVLRSGEKERNIILIVLPVVRRLLNK